MSSESRAIRAALGIAVREVLSELGLAAEDLTTTDGVKGGGEDRGAAYRGAAWAFAGFDQRAAGCDRRTLEASHRTRR